MSVPHHRHPVRTIHETLEKAAWAPWLQFSLADMEAQRALFPEGQIVVDDDEGQPLGALTTLRIDWDEDPGSLTSWDEMSGSTTSPAHVFRPHGNTLLLLSSSVRVPSQGQGTGLRLIGTAQRLAGALGLAHIIGPGRPSGFARHKAEGGSVDFAAYAHAVRDDGLPVDPWIRSLTRVGMRPLKVCERAMVIEATVDEVEGWRHTHRPHRWFRLDDERAEQLVAELPEGMVAADVEVWECGETGSWFVDRDRGTAVYVEHNLWGTFPIKDPDAPLDEHERVIDLTDARRPTPTADVPAAARATPPQGFTIDPALGVLARSLVDEVKARSSGADVGIAWLSPDDPRADVVRALELDALPGVAAFLREELERWCRFLVVVDLAGDPPGIGHVFRVSGHRYGPAGVDDVGMPTVHEVVEANDGVTLDEVVAHYRARGIELRDVIAVESSFRTRPLPGGGLRWSDHGYVELSREVRNGRTGGEQRVGVFAHVNEGTVRSMRGVGLDVEPFAGRPELRSPAGEPGEFDDDYRPVFIPVMDRVAEHLDTVAEMVPPSVLLDPTHAANVVDLRDGVGATADQEPSTTR